MQVFDKNIKAKDVFNNVCTTTSKYNIPIENLEDVQILYSTFKLKYSEYLMQFLTTTCEILNRTYKEIGPFEVDDDELPF